MRIKAWSFSRYNDYVNCPRKAKLKYIDGLKEPPNDAMLRGSKIHKMAEHYNKGVIDLVPDELSKFKKEFEAVRARREDGGIAVIMAEEKWAFTKQWRPCDWFDKNTYCRMIVDLAEQYIDTGQLDITDYKTGKMRDYHIDQLELQALGGFSMYPNADLITSKFLYLDHGVERKENFSRSKDLERLTKDWARKVKPMLNDETFAPRPNPLCGWCYFRKDNGGPCEF